MLKERGHIVDPHSFVSSRNAFGVDINVQDYGNLVLIKGNSYSESGETRSLPNDHSSIFDDGRSRGASISLLGGAPIGELSRFPNGFFSLFGNTIGIQRKLPRTLARSGDLTSSELSEFACSRMIRVIFSASPSWVSMYER